MKTILVYTFLFYASLKLTCQSKNEYHLHLGYSQASQSPTLYNIFLTSYWDQNIHNGYINFEYFRNLKNNNAIGCGLQIVEKGFQNNYTNVYSGYTYNVRYTYSNNYIECPLIYRKTYNQFFISTGCVLSYLLSSSKSSATKKSLSTGPFSEYRGSNIDTHSNNRIDIGFLLRVGYKLKNNFYINLSMVRGFIRPYKYPSGELNFNEVFMFGFSYNLNQ